MHEVTAQPLTPEAFAPFGQVLETPSDVPRLDHAAKLFNGRQNAVPNLLVARVEPRALPLDVEVMERHPASSQAFCPLDVARYLVLVCPSTSTDAPDTEEIQAFIVRPTQGINYAPGVWHHPITPLDTAGTFAVLIWEDGSEQDTEWFTLDPATRVRIRE